MQLAFSAGVYNCSWVASYIHTYIHTYTNETHSLELQQDLIPTFVSYLDITLNVGCQRRD